MGLAVPSVLESMHTPATLESVLARVADAALVVDESGTVLLATDQACHVFKYAPGELHGQSVELLVPNRFRLAHIGHRLSFTDERRARPMGTGLQLIALCKDGSERRVDLSLNPVQRGLETLTVVAIQLCRPDFRTSSGK
jgi:PAS domain S-box-containing protein